MIALLWQFQNDSPIYAQLVRQIKERIVSGLYEKGAKLPSVRELAAEAGVNPNTMQKALTELEREQLVYAQRTTGRFVTENETLIAKAKLDLAENHVEKFLSAMDSLGYDAPEIFAILSSRELRKQEKIETKDPEGGTL